jgi:hypothetical protein
MIQDNYSFHFRDENRNISHSFCFDEGVPHHEIYREFITFLSAVYGYDLHAEYTD